MESPSEASASAPGPPEGRKYYVGGGGGAHPPARQYVIEQGNNSKLVRQLFMRRPWWRNLPEKSETHWNLYWIPYVRRALFDTLKSYGEEATGLNHFEFATKELTSKNGMFLSIQRHFQSLGESPFQFIPWTAVVKAQSMSDGYQSFVAQYHYYEDRCSLCERTLASECHCPAPQPYQNVWIVKPPCCNQGSNISVHQSLDSILGLISTGQEANSVSKQWIVQKYIENPHLYRGRKYDIRVLSCLRATEAGHGLEGFIYKDSYLRTASTPYTLGEYNNLFVHLTNDAIQRQSDAFGSFEESNKVCWPGYKHFLEESCAGGAAEGARQYESIRRQIESIITSTFRSVRKTINPNHLSCCFQMYGYDFMVDTNYKVWLIEINTNPSIFFDPEEVHFKQVMFPRMLDEFLQLTVDEYFPGPPGAEMVGPSLLWSEYPTLQEEPDTGENRWVSLVKLSTD